MKHITAVKLEKWNGNVTFKEEKNIMSTVKRSFMCLKILDDGKYCYGIYNGLDTYKSI